MNFERTYLEFNGNTCSGPSGLCFLVSNDRTLIFCFPETKLIKKFHFCQCPGAFVNEPFHLKFIYFYYGCLPFSSTMMYAAQFQLVFFIRETKKCMPICKCKCQILLNLILGEANTRAKTGNKSICLLLLRQANACLTYSESIKIPGKMRSSTVCCKLTLDI